MRASKKIESVALAVLLGLLAASCTSKKAGGAGFAMPPTMVEASPVAVQPVMDRYEAVGTIEAIEAVTIVSEMAGLVKALPFSEGGNIRKGELIAMMDDAQLAAEVAAAEALQSQSQAAYERIRNVVEQRAGSAQDLDDAAAALKVADANLQLARARFAKSRIVAPFSGMIGARRVSVGAYIQPGEAIASLANIDDIRVTFSAPERFLGQLTRGSEVHVTTTAWPGYEAIGRITVIEPVIEPSMRSARVLAQVHNPERKLRPGMSADIHAILGERPSALTIPNEAVFGSGDQTFVYVINPDSTVSRKLLRLGTRLADVVEVRDGLQSGMTVVCAGHQKLYEGGKVWPVLRSATQTAAAGQTAREGMASLGQE